MFPKKPRILCVDDEDNCEMLELMLQLAGYDYDFVGVSSTDDALKKIAKEKFDLYILEYRLPDIAGIELCRQIRQTDSETPIMFFSGMARPSDRDKAMGAGATEYLIKPNDLDRFGETIERLLRQSPSISQSAITDEVRQGAY